MPPKPARQGSLNSGFKGSKQGSANSGKAAKQGGGGHGYKLTCSINEHHGQPIYGIAFNNIDSHYHHLFATVAGNTASVYAAEAGRQTSLVLKFRDPHEEESFFVCAWSTDLMTGAPLLLFAGRNGVARVVNCLTAELVCTLSGHGCAINDIDACLMSPELILTASKDETIRLWNIDTNVCVAIFKGMKAHSNEVLSVRWHPNYDDRFASASMDSNVKVWQLDEIRDTVQASREWKASEDKIFPTCVVQHPWWSSCAIHGNYVDSLVWYGDYLMTKAPTGCILQWSCDPPVCDMDPRAPNILIHSDFVVKDTFRFTNADLWWIKHSMDVHMRVMAVGNRSGTVFVWRLDNGGKVTTPYARLTTGEARAIVRQTAVSADGNTILAATEAGLVWRWDRDTAQQSATQLR